MEDKGATTTSDISICHCLNGADLVRIPVALGQAVLNAKQLRFQFHINLPGRGSSTWRGGQTAPSGWQTAQNLPG